MRIGEVAERSGAPVKTIRYDEEIGVLAEPPRTRLWHLLGQGLLLNRAILSSARPMCPIPRARCVR